MINGKRILALIPARSGSKGLPGKNIRPLAGHPLLTWPVRAAKASRHVDRVVVSTDSEEFAEIARGAGADVPFLRPPELASDTASSIDVILHAVDFLAAQGEHFDYLVLLEPTSPLTEAGDVDAALEALLANRDNADSLISVGELVHAHPSFAVRLTAEGLLRPVGTENFDQLPRRQDLEPLYFLDGSLYLTDIAALRKERSFCHSRTASIVMPRWKTFEVDDLVDFICIEALLSHFNKTR